MNKKKDNKIGKRAFACFDIIETLHSNWIDIDRRELWIHGVEPFDVEEGEPGIEFMMATKTIKNLYILKAESRKKPVTIHLHTGGGFVGEGLAIYDVVKMMPYKVTMISYTQASSMSGFILQAADTRLLLPHSHFMFHDGEDSPSGTLKQVKARVKLSDMQENQLTEIYIDSLKNRGSMFSKWSTKRIRKKLRDEMDKKEDVYLSAAEAVDWGFADDIITKF